MCQSRSTIKQRNTAQLLLTKKTINNFDLDQRQNKIRVILSDDGISKERVMGTPVKGEDEQTDPPIILSDLENYHLAILELCNGMELIADQLPDNVNSQECLHLARMIYPTIKKAHSFEEEKLFPYLCVKFQTLVLPQTIDRLHCEHWEDESFACEVQEALVNFISKPERANPEALGYMLRGFFEGLRRHIAFERELLGQLIHQKPLLN